MNKKPSPSARAIDRGQKLTLQIKRHAKGARVETLHSARVKHAIQCGKALIQLKEFLGHGGWNRWVERKCAMNRMTANRYIRLVGHASRLKPDMSIREAYIAAGVITPKRPASKARSKT